jgi:hypothetical protein
LPIRPSRWPISDWCRPSTPAAPASNAAASPRLAIAQPAAADRRVLDLPLPGAAAPLPPL